MKITENEFREYENDYMGYCTVCDDITRDCTESDATDYDCPICGKDLVIGVGNALIEGYLEIK